MSSAIVVGLLVFVAGVVLAIAFTIREGRRFLQRLTTIAGEPGGGIPEAPARSPR